MVPTLILNHYSLSSFGFELYYSTKKHKKECTLVLVWIGVKDEVSGISLVRVLLP